MREWLTIEWHKVGDGTAYPLLTLCWTWDRTRNRAVLAKWDGEHWVTGNPNRDSELDVSCWAHIPVPQRPSGA